MDEDQRSDFLLFFQPQIVRIVRRYRNIGSSFEAYLCTHVRFQVKSFFKGYYTRYHKERVMESVEFLYPEASHSMHSDELIPEQRQHLRSFREIRSHATRQRQVREDSLRRRILFFLLKHLHNISESQLSRLAHHYGYDEATLFFLQQQVQERIAMRNERIAALERKRNDLFFLARYLQAQYSVCNNMYDMHKIKKQSQKVQFRIERTSKELKSIPRTLSNQDIAEVLGLPKGTVDSGIFTLKKQLQWQY